MESGRPKVVFPSNPTTIVKSAFNEEGNVIPISTSSVGGQMSANYILLGVYQEMVLGQYIEGSYYTGNLECQLNVHDPRKTVISTREDEFVVFIYTYSTNTELIDNQKISSDRRYALITNYGNILRGSFDKFKADISRITEKDNILTADISTWYHNYNWERGQCTLNTKLIEKELSPKECYTPQLFVDVIATFLKCSQVSPYGDAYKELVQKFKELCYKFTHSGFSNKSKDEEIERLNKLVDSLKGSVKMVSNLNRVVDENEDEIDQLKRELEKSRKNINDLRDKLSYRLLENRKLDTKKAECTRIVRIYKKEVEELENEMANLKSILKVYNI